MFSTDLLFLSVKVYYFLINIMCMTLIQAFEENEERKTKIIKMHVFYIEKKTKKKEKEKKREKKKC